MAAVKRVKFLVNVIRLLFIVSIVCDIVSNIYTFNLETKKTIYIE